MSAISCKQSQLLFENYSNFKRSGAPARFMYYEDGSWVDFSNEALHSLRSGFLEDKPMIEVSIGNSRCLFDFYRMLMIDLETGNQRSIFWIDVDDQCFFPKTFIDGGGDFAKVSENLSSEYPKIKFEIKNDEMNSNKRKRKSVDSEEEGDENTEWSSSSARMEKWQKLLS